MKIYVNRRPIEGPWGGGNLFVSALYDYLPDLGCNMITNPFAETPDVIFLQSPKSDSTSNFSINEAIFLKNNHPHIKIVMRVNDCDARKATVGVDDMWLECSKYVDKTIFVSKWMQQYFIEKGWHCKNNYVVYNGVNLEHFRPREKINNGKVNIVTHHWSNNRMKGFDTYEFIDDFVAKNKDYTFTYIGRDLETFKNTRIIKPIFGNKLGEELSRYDVYISASKFDPGPNHILESIACKLPTIVCKDGGGAIEFARENIFNNHDHLLSIIQEKLYIQNKFKYLQNWNACTKSLDKILRGL